MTREALSFHALSVNLQANYAKLSGLRHRFSSWTEALPSSSIPPPAPEEISAELDRLNLRLVLREDGDFPPLLREMPHPPWGLYFMGKTDLAAGHCLAVVGTRKATPDGMDIAEYFSRRLAAAGVTIISGLALGIDAASHAGALSASGKTAAVLACGLDQVYPRTNSRLADKIIAAGGALVSEYPPGTPPLPHRFLERNRIISGLSAGVLVVEAPERSGSLATARFALEQNRQVFVVPGPARHIHYRGSHALIRQGAELVSEPEHVLQAFGLETPRGEVPSLAGEAGGKILLVLQKEKGGLDIDKIIELTNLETPIVSRALSCLVLAEKIKEEGGRYSLLKD